jgi:hypothetical protein
VIINELNYNHSEEKLSFLLKLMIEWFNSIILALNYKMCCMKFAAKHDCTNTLKVNYKKVYEVNYTKFLGMILGNTISWKNHIESLKGKLNKACYIIKKSINTISTAALKIM